MDERRSQKRIPIEMWVEEVRGTDRYFQRSANISIGGIYLDGTIPHPKGTIVQLKFTLPGEEDAVEVRGEIVGDPTEERLGMHVKFLDLENSESLRERIIRFVDRTPLPENGA
jgi:hypothetical protein